MEEGSGGGELRTILRDLGVVEKSSPQNRRAEPLLFSKIR